MRKTASPLKIARVSVLNQPLPVVHFDPLEMITKHELAHLLKVNPWTIDRWRKTDPEFPPPTWLTGTTLRWRRSDIQLWLAARQRGGKSPDWERTRKGANARREEKVDAR